jgi:hypothetical protein
MKSFKSIFPKAIIVALFLFSSGNFLYAQTQPVFSTVPAEDIKIKFAGTDGEMLVFEVQLENLSAKGAILSILDDQNNTIFEERIVKNNHVCRYKLVGDNMSLVTFKISGKTVLFNQSFTINYKVEEILEVKKV